MASDSPVFVLVGGPNGCGKSTFARQAARTRLLLGTTAINPDEITEAVDPSCRD
jgi:predicted ABC-type ATPase